MTRNYEMRPNNINRRFSVAPMLDWTDRHCRWFLRQISKNALLYTEMVTTGALLHSEPSRWLDYSEDEHPLALQLGGSNPDALAQCANLAEQWGYDEINLNVGCPSDRVKEGRFGACLMAEPLLVKDCISAMISRTRIPVTVKCRIGIDNQDDYQGLQDFVETVASAGCETFIVHARKAWLDGLSPKENREIPPLDYPRVYRLKQEMPHLEIILNGGITRVPEAVEHLNHVDGIMVGREAYNNPWSLSAVDELFFNNIASTQDRFAIARSLVPYLQHHIDAGGSAHHVTRHVLGLFHGVPGGKHWRRYLSENARFAKNAATLIDAALPGEDQTHKSRGNP